MANCQQAEAFVQGLLRRLGFKFGRIYHKGYSQIYRHVQADNKKLQSGDLIAIKVEVFRIDYLHTPVAQSSRRNLVVSQVRMSKELITRLEDQLVQLKLLSSWTNER
jgi:hypothetical protein